MPKNWIKHAKRIVDPLLDKDGVVKSNDASGGLSKKHLTALLEHDVSSPNKKYTRLRIPHIVRGARGTNTSYLMREDIAPIVHKAFSSGRGKKAMINSFISTLDSVVNNEALRIDLMRDHYGVIELNKMGYLKKKTYKDMFWRSKAGLPRTHDRYAIKNKPLLKRALTAVNTILKHQGMERP